MALSQEKSILEQLGTSVLVLDDQLRIVFMNPAAEMLLGFSFKRARGELLETLVRCDGVSFQERLYEYLLSGRTYTERELRLTLTDQREVTVDCTVAPVAEGDLAPAALIEIQQIDRHMRISRDSRQLTELSASREMIRGLAHEVKNPLGGIRGAAQLLQEELESDNLREYTRVIIDEADRLQILVDRMLGPPNRPQKTHIDLHDILEHVYRLVAREAPPGVKLVRDYDPSIPEVFADRDLLIQAFLNIARNAMQAVGSEGKIVFSSRVLHKYTIASKRHRLVANAGIIDNGPGIPVHLQNRVFYPMVTMREGGTGLGLSLAQEFVRQHEGVIELDSRPGRTRFRVLIPVRGNNDRETD